MLFTEEEANEQAVRAYNSGYIDGVHDSRIDTLQECINIVNKASRDYLMVGGITIGAKNRIIESINDLLKKEL